MHQSDIALGLFFELLKFNEWSDICLPHMCKRYVFLFMTVSLVQAASANAQWKNKLHSALMGFSKWNNRGSTVGMNRVLTPSLATFCLKESRAQQMKTPRIPFKEIGPKNLQRLSELGGKPLNLYRMLANNQDLLSAWLEFAYALRSKCSTSRQLRELMILRGAQIAKSDYEWVQHLRMAKESGLVQEKIDQLENWKDSSLYSSEEQAVLQLMEEVMVGKVSDELSKRIKNQFSDSEHVELILTASFYAMVPRVLDGLSVPMEK